MKKIIITLLFIVGIGQSSASLLLDFEHFNARLYGTAESLIVENGDLNNLEVFPASIAGINGQQFATGYVKWMDLVSIYRFGYANNIGRAGTFAVSGTYAGMSEFQNYDSFGSELGLLKDTDMMFNAGYGIPVGKSVRAGFNVKYINSRIAGYEGSCMDAGASLMFRMYAKGKNYVWSGLGVQNVPILKLDLDGEISAYPIRLQSGLNGRFNIKDGFSAKIGGAFSYSTVYNNPYASAGLEISMKNFLLLRAGYYILGRENDKFTLGLGLQGMLSKSTAVGVDYGISLMDGETAHFVQLGMALFPEKKR